MEYSSRQHRAERRTTEAMNNSEVMKLPESVNASAPASGSPARVNLRLWLRGNIVVLLLIFGIGKICHGREIWLAGGKQLLDVASLPHYMMGWVWLMFAIYYLRKQEND